MLLTQRNVYKTLHRMRRLRVVAAGIASLVFCAILLAAQSVQDAKIQVTGDVPTPLSLSVADLASMPRQTAEVTEQDGTKTIYEGVALQDVLKKAGIPFGKE